MACKILHLMEIILRNMTSESQYDDFLNEFEKIESIVDSLGKDHDLYQAHHRLYGEIYACKGALDCVELDLITFYQICKKYAS